ncbi:hypothetical protein JKF63_01012 [Porcisia hertigi]|uniref:Uncharacterized protein n=1 Tax=Porcisia hertigi TaxID=2761500 RepID=A0A836HGW6_9TRYP|nr:hypothetical protein JKF63_01012 [Porcisia hertigi]
MPVAKESFRRRMRKLVAAGEYQLAEELVQADRARREAALSEAAMQLEREGAHQWNILQVAGNQCLLQQQVATLQKERARWERLLSTQAERSRASEEELVRFATSEAAKLNSMPMAVPREVLVLQQQEKQLRLEGSFAAAAQRRGEAAHLREELLDASLSFRRSLLDRRIARQAITLLTRDTVALEKDNDSLAALQVKHAREHQHTTAQLSHIKDGMLTAQKRAHRHIQGSGTCGSFSHATFAKTQRGTALEKRVHGDAYRLPSLCKVYGPLMEDRLTVSPTP